MRCNFQIEGSGRRAPTDVIIDGGSKLQAEQGPRGAAGQPRQGRGPARRPRRRVRRPATCSPAARSSTAIYIEETDGYLLDRVKFFWAADYGNLTFTSDHGLYKNCDGFGAGDAVVYPGAAPETGEQADTPSIPTRRGSTRWSRSATCAAASLAYSGSMGNAVRITEQRHLRQHRWDLDRHDLGRRAPGLPGRQRRDRPQPDLLQQPQPLRDREPAGRAGGRRAALRRRRSSGPATTTAASTTTGSSTTGAAARCCSRSPTRSSTPEGNVNPGVSCPTAPELTTSCSKRVLRQPHGPGAARASQAARRGDSSATPHGGAKGSLPNGADFWWDEATGNTGNCWFDNTGSDGTAASVTGPAPATATTPCPPTARRASAPATASSRRPAVAASSPARATPPPEPATGTSCRRSPARRRRAKRRSFARAARDWLETERAAELEAQMDAISGIPRLGATGVAVRPARRTRCALAAGLALALAGCGGGAEPAAEPEAQRARRGPRRLGRSARPVPRLGRGRPRRARWRRSRDQGRRSTSRTANVKTPELSDEAAYEVIDNTCAERLRGRLPPLQGLRPGDGFASFAE